MLELLTAETLCERAPGYAYVRKVAIDRDRSIVTLEYSTGKRYDVVYPWRVEPEDRQLPDGPQSIVAVHVHDGGVRECVALSSSSHGLRRTSVTIQQALALAAAGTHTVFMTRASEVVPQNVCR